MQLHHLTLNTEHLAIIHDSTVQQDVIDQLLPLVDGGRSEIPGLSGWFIEILSPLDLREMPKAGAAFFQISTNQA